MTNRAMMLARAARMRREPTEPERSLWQALRGSQLSGHKFRRQATIGDRIVDFFCPARGLVIELDGDTHDQAQDRRRDETLTAARGFATLRFTNREVMDNMEGVLETIATKLSVLAPRWPGSTIPGPSSEEEGRV